MTIEAVVFDYGGVLVDMRWDVARAIEGEHGLEQGAIVRTLYSSPSWRQVEIGAYDRDAWLQEAHEALEKQAGRTMPRLHADWRGSWSLIEPNIEIIRRLRGAYRTSVLSNADYTLPQRLREVYGIFDLFDDVVCSAEVGMAKPDPRIYALSAERLQLPPGVCAFIDDTETNCVAAREAGMTAIHFRVDEGHSLAEQLTAIGVVIPAT